MDPTRMYVKPAHVRGLSVLIVSLKVSRLFTAIKGARLVGSGQWAVPCDTTVPLSFTFGSVINWDSWNVL